MNTFHPGNRRKDTCRRKSIGYLNLIRSGLFQTVNDPGGGGFKSPPPLRSRKLLGQSSPYHTCEFYQVFEA